MMAAIEQQSEVYEQERHSRAERERTEGGGRHFAQPLVIRVAVILTYLRLHVPQEVVALLYGCRQSDVSRELRRLLPLISQVLPVPEVWQVMDTAESVVDELPIEALSDGRVLIDATEQRVNRSQDTATRDKHYSGKHKAFTLKTQVMTDGEHHIQVISEAVPGSVHDKVLADELDTVERLPDGCEALADKGYQGLASQVDYVTVRDTTTGTEYQVLRLTLKTPFKKSNNQDLSADQEAFNYRLSAIRIHIEHCIGWAKNWAILANRFRCDHAIYTPVFQLVCGLVNAQTLRWQARSPYCA
jgi:DDE superfamily endonuclease/Helix-turn-helix of DDE superfamily endonuclease